MLLKIQQYFIIVDYCGNHLKFSNLNIFMQLQFRKNLGITKQTLLN